MANLDIKDVYYSMSILEKHQNYLKLLFGGKLYQFTCLPNGLYSGPRKFAKFLKAPLAFLHKMLMHLLLILLIYSHALQIMKNTRKKN